MLLAENFRQQRFLVFMEGHMRKTFKSTLQVLVGMAFVVQLSGCFFWDHDHGRDRHYDHYDHHDDHGPSGIDVHVHG